MFVGIFLSYHPLTSLFLLNLLLINSQSTVQHNSDNHNHHNKNINDSTFIADEEGEWDATAAASVQSPTPSSSDIPYNEVPSSNLYIWNTAAAIFQTGSAAALFVLSAMADSKWRLYTNYPLTLDDRDETPDTFGVPGPAELYSYSVTWYSAVFIALSALDHGVVAWVFRDTYNYYIARNQNPFRWIEYSLSASLMRVMIAQLSGVTDIHLLFMVFSASATTMLVGGLLHESVNAEARAVADGTSAKRQNWLPFVLAWIPHLSSWLVIFSYFLKAVAEADPPNFVWAIVFILFALDGTFAILFWLQWAKIGPFRDYVVGEKGFILLSFTAKALLAWINYGGGSR
jgi:hypothetical protein